MGSNFCNCPNSCVNKETIIDKNLSRKMINDSFSIKQKYSNLTFNKIILDDSNNDTANKNLSSQKQIIKSRNCIPNLKYESSKPSLIENKNMTEITEIKENVEKIKPNEELYNSYFSNKVISKKTDYEKLHIPKINKGQSLDKLIKNVSCDVNNQNININKIPNKYINRNQGNKKIKHRNKLSSLSTKSNTKTSVNMQFHL